VDKFWQSFTESGLAVQADIVLNFCIVFVCTVYVLVRAYRLLFSKKL